MSIWWFGVGLLVVLAAAFLLRPNWFARSRELHSAESSNLDWYSIRSGELAEDEQASVLREDAQLRLLEDGIDGDGQAVIAAKSLNPIWLLVPVVALAAALYWQLGAMGDVEVTRALQGLGADSTDADYAGVMALVEARALQRPDNLHYQAMLGRFYINSGQYGRAQTVYTGLASQSPQDAIALAMAAQASFLAAGRRLDAEGKVLAEQALAINPHQSTALGLLGMVAFEEQRYQEAIGYWERLVAMEDPQSDSVQMINGVIARARQALAAGGTAPVAATGSAAVLTAAADTSMVAAGSVSVTVELPAGATPGPSDTVFVFARDAVSGARMPVAVQRFRASELPRTVVLDDAAAMAGQRISTLEQVTVIARISPNGQPGEANATFQGEVGPLVPASEPESMQLTLQPKKI
ncbi:c-type cytochrome biogenesis protein CcmI [Halieaceae bacterium IMCC14734]|uniref:C-type cytochrome biogenesis protein CcmI n=1 Tax=Candidatus Litorirhabdus singularis TaxID=2518993 RepID=A0ABT3TGV1_9GAMM|nr:c-type cytochrome biogenesis protein CcmI [Candidatus Litorirhabdus singularis]MCX2981501.1 c-type cytochrome biogenesis protein CcmI [Candidatus Litorirhabdus singularis]